MAWLQPQDAFDPDQHPQRVLGIAAQLGRHDSGMHRHGRAQLLFARRGCIHITLADQLCLLPPTRAAWIPAGVTHRAQMQGIVDYRSLYFDPDQCQGLLQQVQVLEVGELLAALLERIAQADLATDWSKGSGPHLVALCLDEIARARREPTLLPLPKDRRLAGLDMALLPPALGVLASQVGASPKTLGRIFQRETGMGYQQWRQQWRLLKAIERLAAGDRHSAIADALGFASDSAFVAFFKQMTGLSPLAYLGA
ncbi:AraC family transcriptional regulator [Gallaecimonas xiamenensis]|uniref:HTH araC/xylS-type domain-containing protein n=1 Tax=Gallaecimonas xiamenensis 3-C-1 TaxID=745411 RepID=K2IZR4_9GAMM|nr:helix-turn-helix transcriptional regulator [Gallaecimonas xiamenensis]EKE68042.1 hypothetical protein B3C1_17582 [Gallaecimonas xiamenensis 3-C-1]